MIKQETMNEIKRVLVEQAQTDTVGLWTVVWDIEQTVSAVTPDEAMRATLAIIRSAIIEDGILVGEVVEQDKSSATFVPWQLSVDESIARIEREWSSLRRRPDPGEIAWFVAPGLLPVTINRHPMGEDWKPRHS